MCQFFWHIFFVHFYRKSSYIESIIGFIRFIYIFFNYFPYLDTLKIFLKQLGDIILLPTFGVKNSFCKYNL